MLEQFIIIGFAAWRLASLLSTEEGPKAIFCRIRERFGFEHDSDGNIVASPEGNLGRGLSCVWCTSVWFAGLAYGVWELVGPAPVVIAAAAGLAVLVEQIIRPERRD